MNSSEYINKERKDYSLYVLKHRALPHIADGLKAGGRRVLWTARDGSKYKSATLAGATMPIHPHQSPEGAVNTLSAFYGNNIPLLTGDGAFGTLLNQTAYGAARYTSTKISQFTKDVIFKDIEIIPMQENYDGTLQEPVHFLPLVPTVLLNPQKGIAVGFASNILSRELNDILNSQLAYLSGKPIKDELPAFTPTKMWAQDVINDSDGNASRYVFRGNYEKLNATTIKVVSIPYGTSHGKYIDFLTKILDDGVIQDFEDNSRDVYNIDIKFKKGVLRSMDDSAIMEVLDLVNNETENLTLIDFGGQQVIKTTYSSIIKTFCDWRLEYYEIRYKRLADLLQADIQRYKDVIRAINRNVGGVAKKVANRTELKEFLSEIGIVYVDYIADLPIYRFTADEKAKAEQKIDASNIIMKGYKKLLKSKKARCGVYIDELKTIKENGKKGKYR